MDNESYRNELRHHFIGQMKNSKFQVSNRPTASREREQRSLTYDSSPTHNAKNSTQQYKEFGLRQQQKLQEYETVYQRRHHHQPQQQQQSQQHQLQQQRRSSGGDADRVLYESSFALQHPHDSYRRGTDSTSYTLRTVAPKSKEPTATPALPSVGTSNKFNPEEPPYLYETDSNMGGASEGSAKSQKSSKTVVSKKSSQELRKMVKSQCKLHEVIDETLKKMCVTGGGSIPEDVDQHIKEPPLQMAMPISMPMPMPALHCKRCTDKAPQSLSRSGQKDVTTEIAKGDFLDCRSGDTLTISVDDVVNSKVINPMIRKLQRMYLNNLKEEMSLMEDLERLPHKVNEVYKATIFKQKE